MEPDTLRPSEEKTDPSERLEKAKKLKEEGNAKFKVEDFPGARKAYAEALRITQKMPEDLASETAELRRPVQLNLALVCLRLDPTEPFRALELCEEVLDAEPENPKATYRKAKALLELGEEKEAEFELVRACKLMPKDATVRKDLEALRQKLRDDKAKEQQSFQGLFEKNPGFASEGRVSDAQRLSKADVDDIYFHDGKENPYEGAERPEELARDFQLQGRLEDATQAYEVAMGRSAQEENWLSHLSYALDYGALLMDLNIDRLALRCFNTVFERPAEPESAAQPLRQHALLLKAICLLNESSDAEADISECLEKWLQLAHPGEAGSVVERLQRLKEEGKGTADTVVALGLMQLLQSQESLVNTFADAVILDDLKEGDSFFGTQQRRATRWNMLGAVLANRGQPEKAISVWRQALQCQPHYPRALVNMAMSQLKCGDFLGACASQAKALKVLPPWATEEIWQQLEKEAQAQTNIDELFEAVHSRHITKVEELLEPHASMLETSQLDTDPAKVLKSLKLIN